MTGSVEAMFSIPLFQAVRPQPLTPEEHRSVRSISYQNNVGNSTSRMNYILDELPALRAIGEFCQSCVDQFMRDVVGTDDKLKITISWANRTSAGQRHHQHFHPNSVLSGSFYFQDTATSPITFTNPLREHSNFEFNLVRNPSQFNAASKSSAAPANSCVIFPSWVRHDVPPLPAGTPDRYSIAFNTFLSAACQYGSDRYRTSIRW